MQNRIVVLKKGVTRKEAAELSFCCKAAIAPIMAA